MSTAFEQELAALRGVLYLADMAKSSHAQLLQHRPLVGAIRRALALLAQPHPHDEPLRFALLALMSSTRRGECGNWYVTDADMYRFSMDQISRLHGPVE